MKKNVSKYLFIGVASALFLYGCANNSGDSVSTKSTAAIVMQQAMEPAKVYDENRELKAGPVAYDCEFDIHDYYRYPVIRQFDNRGALYNWLRRNVLGGIQKNPGRAVMHQIDRLLAAHQNNAESSNLDDDQLTFLSLGSQLTRNKMSYIVRIKNQVVSFINIPSEDVQRFNFSEESAGILKTLMCAGQSDDFE